MPLPRPGTTFQIDRGESFTVVKVLGQGGMGTVVDAKHAPSGRRLALKFLHDDLLDHPTIPRRFQREVELATALSSAHVARTFGVETTADGTTFMVMEMLDGADLSSILRREGPMSTTRACTLIAQACEALEEAHARGIVHRDLKPENLFVTRASDGSDWVKVLDFGISKIIDRESVVSATGPPSSRAKGALTRAGTTVGTPEYMAPEQLRGVADLDGAADVYSLGVVLYELLAGRRPFTGTNHDDLVQRIADGNALPLDKLRPGLPLPLYQVVASAMARGRSERIPTAKALRDALLPFTTTDGRKATPGTMMMEPVAPPPPPSSVTERPLADAGRVDAAAPKPARRWLLLVGALAAVAVIAGVIAYVATN